MTAPDLKALAEEAAIKCYDLGGGRIGTYVAPKVLQQRIGNVILAALQKAHDAAKCACGPYRCVHRCQCELAGHDAGRREERIKWIVHDVTDAVRGGGDDDA